MQVAGVGVVVYFILFIFRFAASKKSQYAVLTVDHYSTQMKWRITCTEEAVVVSEVEHIESSGRKRTMIAEAGVVGIEHLQARHVGHLRRDAAVDDVVADLHGAQLLGSSSLERAKLKVRQTEARFY